MSQHIPRSDMERPRSYDSARIPFQAVNESERRIWQHFESYKRSAILHAEQYLRYSAIRKHDPDSFIDVQLSSLMAPGVKQESPINWGREAAQDDLYDDLQVLQSLSDHMLHVSKKRLPRYYVLVATL
ncbi:hypothetical protein yc1106_06733 [Curvularia clavata]|uniref:Uncharacterized protein n=1 Tax=Curvularia clavata TaxID=95742 RepID=A0A9Q8ZDH0_CURCL|nr:hypothetical protein yc1106_06733 [Curvularia clavata]